MVSVILHADHPLMLAGLKAYFDSVKDFRVAAHSEGDGGVSSLAAAHAGDAAVVLRGTLTSEDCEQIATLSNRGVRVAVLLLRPTGQQVTRAIRAGASAILTVPEGLPDIVDAIRDISGGIPYVDKTALLLLMSHISGQAPEAVFLDTTPSEVRVLRRLALGGSNDEIAADLRMTSRTVKEQLARIYSKLGVTDRGAAIAKAYREGLVV
jgi:DNA-binding NarL/FixJ family response regulator